MLENAGGIINMEQHRMERTQKTPELAGKPRPPSSGAQLHSTVARSSDSGVRDNEVKSQLYHLLTK